MTERLQLLTDWSRGAIEKLRGEPVAQFRLDTLSGDASFRRYYRVRLPDISYVVVDAPPANENSRNFVAIADRMRAGGVRTPRILARDFEAGFMLQEDFGDQLYLAALQRCEPGDAAMVDLYHRAIDSLVTLQRNVKADQLPPYDRTALLNEMRLFQDWFCTRFLALALTPAEQGLIARSQEFLAAAALAQPRVVVHRDYHSRNLMLVARAGANPAPGVIDFQDAVVGAYTYDLVSLLRDCYIELPNSLLLELARYYKRGAETAGLIKDIDEPAFLRDFDLMGLQRHLKVMGIFARLNIRDGKPGYLADIPQTMSYFLDVAARYDELADLLAWFGERVLPVARKKLPGVA